MATVMKLNLKAKNGETENEAVGSTSKCRTKKEILVELGNGSHVIYMPKFLNYEQSWNYLEYLNKNIPWNRPTLRVFGRSCLQPRDSCYVASEGLPQLVYSGYQPHAYSWDEFPPLKDILDAPRDSCYVASEGLPQLVYSGYQPHAYSWDEFPPLKDILDAVHKALPGSRFNSLLLNRYKGGDDYVGWHADDEKLYGPTPEIASLSFGCEREFLLKKRPNKLPRGNNTGGEPPKKQPKKDGDQHSFVLKHGSLLVMRGYTQRDWLHSVPKRVKADSVRINLTFRLVL